MSADDFVSRLQSILAADAAIYKAARQQAFRVTFSDESLVDRGPTDVLSALVHHAFTFRKDGVAVIEAVVRSVETDGAIVQTWDDATDDWGGDLSFLPFGAFDEAEYL